MMADLIDRLALGNRMYHEAFEKDSDMQKWDSGCWIRYKLFENVLRDTPSVDAVEVVRCKDCVFGHLYVDVQNGVTDSWIECRNPDGLNRDVSEDSFCSYGERK